MFTKIEIATILCKFCNDGEYTCSHCDAYEFTVWDSKEIEQIIATKLKRQFKSL